MNAHKVQPAGGFTLIELLVTLAILALLASIAIPVAETAVRRGKERDLLAALREIRSALDAYKQASDAGSIPRSPLESGYPPSLEILVGGVVDAKSPDSRKMYFLRRIPRDPFAPDPKMPPQDTWALRSYASPPDAPAPGRDVFDVRSRSNEVGLNGIPYQAW